MGAHASTAMASLSASHPLLQRWRAPVAMLRRARHAARTLRFNVFLLTFLPSLIFFFDLSSSVSLGTSVAAAILIHGGLSVPGRQVVGLSPAGWVLAVLGVLAVHAAVAIALTPSFDVVRAGGSLLLVVLVVLAGVAFGRLLLTADDRQLHRALILCFNWLCVCAILPKVGLSIADWIRPGRFSKPMFPFTEPSHFALVFMPFLLYRCVTARDSHKVLWLAGSLGIALVVQNLTLLVGSLLVGIVSLRVRSLLLWGLVAVALASTLDLSYFQSRVDVSDDTAQKNLSMLVYFQGWELMAESLVNTHGWGLGFQQLGVSTSDVDAAETIYDITGEYLNMFDGGFVLSKLVSELGALGLVLVAAYLARAVRAVRDLRGRRGLSAVTFANCVIVGYLTELLVRGVGYFTGTFIMLVAAFWLLAAVRSAPGRRGKSPAG